MINKCFQKIRKLFRSVKYHCQEIPILSFDYLAKNVVLHFQKHIKIVHLLRLNKIRLHNLTGFAVFHLFI